MIAIYIRRFYLLPWSCAFPDDVKQSHLYTVNMLNFSIAYFDPPKKWRFKAQEKTLVRKKIFPTHFRSLSLKYFEGPFNNVTILRKSNKNSSNLPDEARKQVRKGTPLSLLCVCWENPLCGICLFVVLRVNF